METQEMEMEEWKQKMGIMKVRDEEDRVMRCRLDALYTDNIQGVWDCCEFPNRLQESRIRRLPRTMMDKKVQDYVQSAWRIRKGWRKGDMLGHYPICQQVGSCIMKGCVLETLWKTDKKAGMRPRICRASEHIATMKPQRQTVETDQKTRMENRLETRLEEQSLRRELTLAILWWRLGGTNHDVQILSRVLRSTLSNAVELGSALTIIIGGSVKVEYQYTCATKIQSILRRGCQILYLAQVTYLKGKQCTPILKRADCWLVDRKISCVTCIDSEAYHGPGEIEASKIGRRQKIVRDSPILSLNGGEMAEAAVPVVEAKISEMVIASAMTRPNSGVLSMKNYNLHNGLRLGAAVVFCPGRCGDLLPSSSRQRRWLRVVERLRTVRFDSHPEGERVKLPKQILSAQSESQKGKKFINEDLRGSRSIPHPGSNKNVQDLKSLLVADKKAEKIALMSAVFNHVQRVIKIEYQKHCSAEADSDFGLIVTIPVIMAALFEGVVWAHSVDHPLAGMKAGDCQAHWA
ncbi:hypothetical protein Tco_0652216 [Tanacetum coccineum]|uniref:Uncharacterized protein n=1 Tax=Tanacetum coccineum TaxID=301880 RepID=A0ABQ4WWY7_9ASTR